MVLVGGGMATKKRVNKKNFLVTKKLYDTSRLASSELINEPLHPIQIHSLPGKQTLNVLGFGYAFALLRVGLVLVVSVLGLSGYASGAVSLLETLHFTFSLTAAGIVAGLAETALWGFLMGMLFAWVYNRFV